MEFNRTNHFIKILIYAVEKQNNCVYCESRYGVQQSSNTSR